MNSIFMLTLMLNRAPINFEQIDIEVNKICIERRSINTEYCKDYIKECLYDEGDAEWCANDYFNNVELDLKEINRFCNDGIISYPKSCYQNIEMCYVNTENLDKCFKEYQFPKNELFKL